MRDAAQHLRTTLRSLTRQPGLTVAVNLTLALGIGASTALFAYLRAIVWPAFDAPDPERVVWLYTGTKEDPRGETSYLDYVDLREGSVTVLTSAAPDTSPARRPAWRSAAASACASRA